MFNKNEVEIIDFKKEEKKRQQKAKIQNKINSVINWISNNKEVVLLVGPSLLACTTAGIKAVSKHVNLHKEQDLKDLYCYDRSLGHYWRLRRELTNAEWVQIDKRKKNGERLADILDELKVLK